MYDSTNNVGLGDRDPFNKREFMSENMAVTVRHGFVKKVFGILGIQLLVTTAIASPFVIVDFNIMQDWLHANIWIYFVAIATTLACCMVLCCCGGLMRKFPWNYTILSLFTLAEGVCVGVTCLYFETLSVIVVAEKSITIFCGVKILSKFSLKF